MKKEEWVCDFCGKDELRIAKDGVVYCGNCYKSYDETIYDLALKLAKEIKRK